VLLAIATSNIVTKNNNPTAAAKAHEASNFYIL
jgi:hypothetical protein